MVHQPGVAESVWRERLARYLGSDLTVKAFCEREGVSASNFHAWKRRLKPGVKTVPSPRKPEGQREAKPLFVPVALSGLALDGETAVRIELPGGAVVHVPLGADERVLACAIEAAVRASQEGGAC